MNWAILAIIITISAIGLAFYLKLRKNQLLEALKTEAQRFVDSVNQRKGLEPVEVHNVVLKTTEKAFLAERTTLLETRAVRRTRGVGVGGRVMKGVYLGTHSSESRSHQELQTIDSGTLVLTNDRLIFDGSQDNRSVKLEKIFSVQPWRDAIEVSVEGRQKSMMFRVDNPFIWALAIRIAGQEENPEALTRTVGLAIT